MKPYKKELMILAAVMSFFVACGVNDKAVKLSPHSMFSSSIPVIKPVNNNIQYDTIKIPAVVSAEAIKPVISPVIQQAQENGKKLDRATDLIVKLDKLVKGQGSANSKLDKVVTMLYDERAGRIRAETRADKLDSIVRDFPNQLKQQGNRTANQLNDFDKGQKQFHVFVVTLFAFVIGLACFIYSISKKKEKRFNTVL